MTLRALVLCQSKSLTDWLLTDWLTDWLAGWLADWLTADWLTDWLLHDWQTDWLTADWLTDWLTDWLLTDWLHDWLTADWLTSWLADWLTDWLLHDWLTDRQTDWLIYSVLVMSEELTRLLFLGDTPNILEDPWYVFFVPVPKRPLALGQKSKWRTIYLRGKFLELSHRCSL